MFAKLPNWYFKVYVVIVLVLQFRKKCTPCTSQCALIRGVHKLEIKGGCLEWVGGGG